MTTPGVWNLAAEETLTFLMPKDEIVLYDPINSHWDQGQAGSGCGLKEVRGKVALATVIPDSVAIYSKTDKSLYFTAPDHE